MKKCGRVKPVSPFPPNNIYIRLIIDTDRLVQFSGRKNQNKTTDVDFTFAFSDRTVFSRLVNQLSSETFHDIHELCDHACADENVDGDDNGDVDGGNDVDGTEGHWTMQEGADSMYLINRLTGKKFRISMTEVS